PSWPVAFSLHDALPIWQHPRGFMVVGGCGAFRARCCLDWIFRPEAFVMRSLLLAAGVTALAAPLDAQQGGIGPNPDLPVPSQRLDRKSTRLNSSHVKIS